MTLTYGAATAGAEGNGCLKTRKLAATDNIGVRASVTAGCCKTVILLPRSVRNVIQKSESPLSPKANEYSLVALG